MYQLQCTESTSLVYVVTLVLRTESATLVYAATLVYRNRHFSVRVHVGDLQHVHIEHRLRIGVGVNERSRVRFEERARHPGC